MMAIISQRGKKLDTFRCDQSARSLPRLAMGWPIFLGGTLAEADGEWRRAGSGGALASAGGVTWLAAGASLRRRRRISADDGDRRQGWQSTGRGTYGARRCRRISVGGGAQRRDELGVIVPAPAAGQTRTTSTSPPWEFGKDCNELLGPSTMVRVQRKFRGGG